MRSSKTATTFGGAVRALSNITAQPPSSAYTSQISSFIDKWKSFESTMASARAMKEGPLRPLCVGINTPREAVVIITPGPRSSQRASLRTWNKWLPPDFKEEEYISPTPVQIYSQRSESNKQITATPEKIPEKELETIRKEKEMEQKTKINEELKLIEQERVQAQAVMNHKVGKLNDQMFVSTLKEMEKRQKDNITKMNASSPGQEYAIDPRGTYDPKKWSAPKWKDGVKEDGTSVDKLAQGDQLSSLTEDLSKGLNENDAFIAAAEQEPIIKKIEKDKMDIALDEMEKRRESKESIMSPGRIEWTKIDPVKIFDAKKL